MRDDIKRRVVELARRRNMTVRQVLKEAKKRGEEKMRASKVTK